MRKYDINIYLKLSTRKLRTHPKINYVEIF